MNIYGVKQIEEARDIIAGGGVLVVPTSRWYMICADAFNHNACERMFEAKGRPKSKQLLTVMPDNEAVEQSFILSAEAVELAEKLWPGDLFIKLNWKQGADYKPNEYLGQDSALINVPDGYLGELSNAFGKPIASTSTGLSFKPGDDPETHMGPSVTLEEVLDFIKATNMNVDGVVDGGVCPHFLHSTTVDCTDNSKSPEIVRVGTTHPRVINQVLQELKMRGWDNANCF